MADDPRPDGMLIPATLHDLLMSQLDRLGPQAKGAAQLGAVIGRTFPYWLLSGLWWGDQQGLRDLLDDIVAARLMTRRHLGSEEHYVFEHELVRDTAYDSLLESKRKELHLQIAQIITSERTRLSDMRPELIALPLHGRRSGHKAAVLWLEAGQLALRESANHEARSSLQSGLRCLQYLPEDQDRWRLELRLQTCLGQALIAISGHASPEVLHAFSRAHELSDRIEQVPELFTIVWGITAHHLVKGDIRRHLELSNTLLEIAQTSKDPSRLIVAHTSRTLSLYFAGRFGEARQHLNQVLDRYDWDLHRHLARTYAIDRKTITMQFGAWTLWKLGYADQAARLVEDMISHARRLGHANSLAQALTAGASVYMLRREPDVLLAKVEEGVAIAKAHGYPVWVDHADFWVGWALAEKGHLKQGIEHLNTAMEAYRRHGAGSSLPKFLRTAGRPAGRGPPIRRGPLLSRPGASPHRTDRRARQRSRNLASAQQASVCAQPGRSCLSRDVRAASDRHRPRAGGQGMGVARDDNARADPALPWAAAGGAAVPRACIRLVPRGSEYAGSARCALPAARAVMTAT